MIRTLIAGFCAAAAAQPPVESPPPPAGSQWLGQAPSVCAIQRPDKGPQLLVTSDRQAAQERPPRRWSLDLEKTPAAPVLEELALACGSEARHFVELALATCRPDHELQALLANPAILALPLPALPTAVGRNYWQAAREVGCARVVSSSDGRARIWTLHLEGAEIAGDRPQRGSALLQWRDAKGAVHLSRDPAGIDLHLDTIVDALEPLPGEEGRFLILGLRSLLQTYAGSGPRRYAQVIQLGMDSPSVALVEGAFVTGATRSSRLLLGAPDPETGKFRHSALARRWLRFHPGSGALQLEDVPRAGEAKAAPVVVGVLRGGTFHLEPAAFGELYASPDW